MNKNRLRGVFSHRLFIILLLLLQIAFFGYLVLSGSESSWLVSLFFSLVSMLVAIHVVSKHEKPGYKLTWVFTILTLPIFGGAFYLMMQLQPSVHGFRKQVESSQEALTRRLPRHEGALREAEAQGPCASRLARYLENSVGFPVYPTSRVEYYPSGEAFFEALLRELPKAKRYIFVEFFILQEGEMWGEVLKILEQKAREGVEVRVLYDDFGCFVKLPRDYCAEVRAKGIQCEVFSPFRPALTILQNNRDHRKIVSIDGVTAFTGGANLADEYINRVNRFGIWRDAAIMEEGESAWALTLMFLQMWGLATRRLPLYERFTPEQMPAPIPGNGYVQPYCDSPLDIENVAERVYMQIITGARKYVYISTPYLIVDDLMLSALTLAAKSGVDVRILTPENWDKRLVHMTTRSYYRELIDGGVKIYEFTGGFNHAKTFVCDDTVATVGTVNMDYRSLYLHFECGVCLYGGGSVLDVKRDFLETIARCHQITPEECEAGGLRRMAREVLRIFEPLM